MQAVILAGGLGTRLWPLTRDIPKPMVPVAGAPYLEHQLRLFARQGFSDIVLLTGYLGDQIEEFFGDGADLGIRIRYSREAEPLGTGGAVRDAADLLEDCFLLVYGDSYLPIDYADPLAALAESDALGLVVAYSDPQGATDVQNNLAIGEGGRVLRYEKGTDDPDLTHVEAGVLAFRREILDLMPSTGKFSLEMEMFPDLIDAGKLIAFPTEQRFYDIGTPSRLGVIEELLA